MAPPNTACGAIRVHAPRLPTYGVAPRSRRADTPYAQCLDLKRLGGVRSRVHPGRRRHRLAFALRTHLSYANVMATVAVFLALGGGAYALSLPRNSVTSRHIAKGQVKGSDIGKNAVKSPRS